jgi:hypothetical protein
VSCVGYEERKARKKHRCLWCGEDIEPGQKYARWCSIDGRDACTCKMHPECAKVSSGQDEIYPYEHKRGEA